jgi:hypothetical protein
VNPQNQSPSAGGEKPLPLKDACIYNLAAFSLNVYETILSAWVLFFYVPPEDSGQVRLIPMAVLGFILAGGRILDASPTPLSDMSATIPNPAGEDANPIFLYPRPFYFLHLF